jgi:hypothetical protein
MNYALVDALQSSVVTDLPKLRLASRATQRSIALQVQIILKILTSRVCRAGGIPYPASVTKL